MHAAVLPMNRPESVWFGRIDRLTRNAWLLTWFAILFGLIGGWITFATGIGGESGDWTQPGYRPPLFFVLANFVYVLAVLASLPALGVAAARAFRGAPLRAALDFARGTAPIAVWLAFTLASHSVGCALPMFCHDGSFTGRAHLLHHTVVAGLPAALALTATVWLLPLAAERRTQTRQKGQQ